MTTISNTSSVMYTRPDPSKMMDKLFSKIDANTDGSISKDELQTALDQMPSDGTSSTTSSSASNAVDQIFKASDSNGDNLLPQQEFADGLKKLAAQFESQSGSTGGMPPGGMPPGEMSGGMSKDDITNMATEVGKTDSTAASQLNDLAANFDVADTNKDGKVSMQETMAYQEKQQSSSTTSSSVTSSSSGSQSQSNLSALMKQIAQLVKTYGMFDQTPGLSTASNLSVAA
jgi:Ca2+-binding EF-hand superfamily protein